MAPAILEIQPRELKFTFELKKQSSCSVHLVNNSNSYVAFKIKTTSPKRYCVRPNTGVILPRSECDFTVTMQAQKAAPPDMQLKDKFLVQSTVVPFGTTDEDIVPNFFSKESGRQIEECKLRVMLVSPPHSPVLQPLNGSFKQEPIYESPPLKDVALKEAPTIKESPILIESLKEEPTIKESPTLIESTLLKDSSISNEAPTFKESLIAKDRVSPAVQILHLTHDAKYVDDLKLKIGELEVRLSEAEKTIASLREEKIITIEERDKLQQEVVLLTRKCPARVQAGYPFLFVCFIALVGIALGYILRL